MGGRARERERERGRRGRELFYLLSNTLDPLVFVYLTMCVNNNIHIAV